jgi:putative transposase
MWICQFVQALGSFAVEEISKMGISAFQQNTRLRIESSEYVLLRKISDSCWQLENTTTKRILEFEQDRLLRMFAEGKLTFVSREHKGPLTKLQTQVSSSPAWEVAKLRRMYVLAVLGVPNTRRALEQAT